MIHAMNLFSGLSLLCLFAVGTATAQPSGRVKLNEGWRFYRGDAAPGDSLRLSYERLKPFLLPAGKQSAVPDGAPDGGDFAAPEFDDSAWRTLDLPHDWGIEGPFRQEYPGETGKLPWWGRAWYRRTIRVGDADLGKRIFLEIDGAMSFSTVWCNGRLAGGWPYGYTSYRVDLTPCLVPGDNTLAIRLDNPPESSRWYPGGGIYRNVWLTKSDPVGIAHWGTFVTTPHVTSDRASVNLRIELRNDGMEMPAAIVTTELFALGADGACSGEVLARAEDVVDRVEDGQLLVQEFSVDNPRLWGPGHPDRYVAVTTVRCGDRVVERYSTPFGIRRAEFTHEGFFLNGERLMLQGVCMHHDLGALGAAINVSAIERQLHILREMGTNAIRTAHNPPAPELLELCDRMGFLVLDEFTDTWRIPKKPNGYALLFDDWGTADLTALIRRDRNHPSVIAWSTGNETAEQWYPETYDVSRELTDLVHREDPSRPATFGSNYWLSASNDFRHTVDIFGFNYKPMLYEGFCRNSPFQPFMGSETASCISTRGFYVFPLSDDKGRGRADFQVSSYDRFSPDWSTPPDTEFEGLDRNPTAAGEFVWTGFDYLGEPTPYNDDYTILENFSDPEARTRAAEELARLGRLRIPSRSSYFGIVDLAGFPKDRYYLYQARWRPDLPMAHILPHWTWPGREGEVTPVHVYTSGDAAELFVNGRSQGLRRKGVFEYRLRWDSVRYEPGEVRVVAYRNGKPWAENRIETAGKVAFVELTVDRTTVQAGSEDLFFVTAKLTDRRGRFVPQAADRLDFSVEGPARIVATDNGDPTSHASFQSPSVNAFNGLALVVLRPTGEPGDIRLKVRSRGIRSFELQLRVE